MICQSCGVEAPTRQAAYYQNIGALVMRFSSSMSGQLCKSCHHRYFWQFTGVNMVAGWWGMISLVVNPCFIANNVVRYLMVLGMEPAPLDAAVPQLTDEVIQRLHPHADELFQRLNSGEPLAHVAESIAPRARVTPGQVALYLRAMVASQQQQA
jgi:hypothetical protein